MIKLINKESEKTLSVLLVLRNEGSYISSLLEKLTKQTIDPSKFELIIIDGESKDNTRTIIAGFKQESDYSVKFISNPKQTLPLVGTLEFKRPGVIIFFGLMGIL